MDKITIIVLTYKQAELTRDCVNSILKNTKYPDFEVLIVDNASKDGSVEKFEEEFSNENKVRILENSENEGYAGGNNFGVKKTKTEKVVILNNDTIVTEKWLIEMNKILEKENVTAVSAFAPIVNKKGEITRKRIGNKLNYLWVPVDFKTIKEFGPESERGKIMIGGCCFLYKKSVRNPPFDKDYFIYAEDIEFGWWLEVMGYKKGFAKDARVNHFHNTTKKSSKSFSKFATYLGTRNRAINFLKFYETKNLLKLLPYFILDNVAYNVAIPRGIPSNIKAYLWLIWNWKKILKKRNEIQKERKVPDSEILPKLSSEFRPLERTPKIARPVVKMMNILFNFYSKIVGLR